MDSKAIRRFIMEKMFEAYSKQGKYARVSLADMADELTKNGHKIDSIQLTTTDASYLADKGLISLAGRRHIQITNMGIDFAENGYESPGLSLSVRDDHSVTFNVGGSINHSQISFGDTNITLTADQLMTKMELALDAKGISGDEKKSVLGKFSDLLKHPAFIAALPEFLKAVIS